MLESLGAGGAVMLKAAAGGGGRGMRVVRDAGEVDEAFARCRSEAGRAFGDDTVFVERYLAPARHIEVQIVGDGTGAVVDLGERDCSIQRRHQKLVEIAPSPGLGPATRQRVVDAACALPPRPTSPTWGPSSSWVDATADDAPDIAFIEANPRLQVEHTVTEEVTGVDLVRTQLRLAAGATLADLGLVPRQRPELRGSAIQVRINAERMGADGTTPTSGILSDLELPAGPGVRVDTAAYRGYEVNPGFDSLVAKVVVHAPHGGFGDAVSRAYRALSELHVEGVATNLGFLQNLLRHPDFAAGHLTVGFVADHLEELTATDGDHPRRYVGAPATPAPAGLGARLESTDPLAVLDHGRVDREQARAATEEQGPRGASATVAPVQGTIVEVAVEVGEEVQRGQTLVIMEAMKMEHVVAAQVGGVVRQVEAEVGHTLADGEPLVFVESSEDEADDVAQGAEIDLDASRPDLEEVQERHRLTLD